MKILGDSSRSAVLAVLMLTSFDPFGGSAQNNTQPIAAALKQMGARISAAAGTPVTVEVCNLPVVYDVGAQTAMSCVEQFHPDYVVSMGEAACDLRIETAATNLDNVPGFKDNSGQIRQGTEIVPGGPGRSGFHFPVDAMYCALKSSTGAVVISRDPGAFVCNNTAYHLSQELAQKDLPFTFIHVPNSRCTSAQKDPQKNAQTILQMLGGAIARIRGSGAPEMPATKTGAQEFLRSLQKVNAQACELTFAQKLIATY